MFCFNYWKVKKVLNGFSDVFDNRSDFYQLRTFVTISKLGEICSCYFFLGLSFFEILSFNNDHFCPGVHLIEMKITHSNGVRTFHPEDISPRYISPQRHFTPRTFHPTDISPHFLKNEYNESNGIRRKNSYCVIEV